MKKLISSPVFLLILIINFSHIHICRLCKTTYKTIKSKSNGIDKNKIPPVYS